MIEYVLVKLPNRPTPFCRKGGIHHVGTNEDRICVKCRSTVTNSNSEHMGTETGTVIMCDACIVPYKEMWALGQVVGA